MSEEIAARIEENEAIKSFIAHRDAGDLCDTRVDAGAVDYVPLSRVVQYSHPCVRIPHTCDGRRVSSCTCLLYAHQERPGERGACATQHTLPIGINSEVPFPDTFLTRKKRNCSLYCI